jgi:hypothetical protein
MGKAPSLNDEEWQVIVELLESEQKELPAEIHHTDSTDYKAKLSKRLQMVNQLLQILRK